VVSCFEGGWGLKTQTGEGLEMPVVGMIWMEVMWSLPLQAPLQPPPHQSRVILSGEARMMVFCCHRRVRPTTAPPPVRVMVAPSDPSRPRRLPYLPLLAVTWPIS
jgi:hypothetical protein